MLDSFVFLSIDHVEDLHKRGNLQDQQTPNIHIVRDFVCFQSEIKFSQQNLSMNYLANFFGGKNAALYTSNRLKFLTNMVL